MLPNSNKKYMQDGVNIYRVMPTSALRALVNNLVKESFYGKKKINVLTVFFISHKSYVKTFLKWIVNGVILMPHPLPQLFAQLSHVASHLIPLGPPTYHST